MYHKTVVQKSAVRPPPGRWTHWPVDTPAVGQGGAGAGLLHVAPHTFGVTWMPINETPQPSPQPPKQHGKHLWLFGRGRGSTRLGRGGCGGAPWFVVDGAEGAKADVGAREVEGYPHVEDDMRVIDNEWPIGEPGILPGIRNHWWQAVCVVGLHGA